MKLGIPIDIKLTLRYFDFNRQFAITDVYDALVELITNSDDSYHRLYSKQLRSEDGGPILVELCEQRKGGPSLIIVYDRAEGMTLKTMFEKFGSVGDKGSAEGDRGFMGRGAKDCTVLGKMTFESIKDEKYYKCELTTKPQFTPLENGRSTSKEIRKRLRIGRGNGTRVQLEVASQKIPHIGTIVRDLPWHYALRDILSEHSPIKLLVKNLNKPNMAPESAVYRQPEGELVCEESFVVPGYPEAKAKLKIWRAASPFEDPNERFRRSGLLIKGERAVHECSLIHPGIEKALPYAKKYFGRLECDFIDRLLNEYDDRRKNNIPHPPENPSLLIDPNRRTGLRDDHPFTNVLFQLPSERLRQLIEKDKEQDKSTQREIASRETQQRLNKLAKAASRFLTQQVEDLEELSTDDKVDEKSFSREEF